jgi:hypothetical protein
MEDASDTRIQVNLILVELFGRYVPVHYLGVVSLGLDWQLNKDISFSELVPNLASVPNKINRAPMEFAVFPYIKSFLCGQRFNDLPELRQEVMNIILNMKTEQFEKIFDDWLKRCKKCVELNGEGTTSRKVNFYYC